MKEKGIDLGKLEPTGLINAAQNVKENPEMFIHKILKSQKRINKTIEIYELEHKE